MRATATHGVAPTLAPTKPSAPDSDAAGMRAGSPNCSPDSVITEVAGGATGVESAPSSSTLGDTNSRMGAL